MRTIEWDPINHTVRMIDQRLLPGEFRVVAFDDYRQVARAVTDMVIRGAPAIGAAAAFGLALAAKQSSAMSSDSLKSDLVEAGRVLVTARPTAINLKWAVDRILSLVRDSQANCEELRMLVLDEAQNIADEDVEINKRMASFGAELLDDGDVVIHHCNTGSLATVDWGTALGVIRTAHDKGKHIHILVDETRPRLQGARLTAWELEQYGIPYEIISDNAAGYFLSSGIVHKVLFGADRVAANGDVANKIGTYMLALAAHANNVPAYAVVPTSTIDLSVENGSQIPIEERSPEEVLAITRNGQPISPPAASARNPAFDITPARLISAIITEHGIVTPPYTDNLRKIVLEKAG